MRVVLGQMEPYEPVLAVKVTVPGEDAGIASRLSVGMQGFAISVDVSSGVSVMLRPGDREDVYWSGNLSEKGAEWKVTQLIESGLRFVAIDQRAHDNLAEAAVAGTVTIEVLPQQVAKLAQATGSLLLSLADQGDATVADAIEVDQCSLLDLDDAPVEVAEEDPPILPAICTVRTPRGAEVVEMPVVCPTNYARRVKSNGRTGRRGGPCGPPPTGTAPGQPPLDLTSHPPHPAAEGDGPRDQGAYAQ